MATKKAVAKKKTTGTAMMTQADAEKAWAAEAELESARIKAAGGNILSFKDGTFSYKGASLGNELSCVILGFSFENRWYGEDFNPASPVPPACFALSVEEDDMKPHEDAPEKQSNTCAECDLNQWGSSKRGTGKACSNRIRIALVHADDISENLSAAEIVVLNIPPTSLAGLRKHAKGCEAMVKRPLRGVVTHLKAGEGEDSKRILFSVQDKLEARHKTLIDAKAEEAGEILLQGYDYSGYVPLNKRAKSKPVRGGGKAAPKAKSKFRR